jgi:hypothetical protein
MTEAEAFSASRFMTRVDRAGSFETLRLLMRDLSAAPLANR